MRGKRKGTVVTDTILGMLIPLAFLALAGYQQATTGAVDKYVIGALLIFGLGALGWRIDTILEKYLAARQSITQDMANAGLGEGDEQSDDNADESS